MNYIDDSVIANDVIDYRDGWAIGTAFGKRVSCNRRREFELTYRNNSFDTASGATGTLNHVAAMGNVLFDRDLMRIDGAKMYAGGGVGLAYGDFEVDTVGRANSYAFAYQFIAGIDKAIGYNGTRAFLEYRYFGNTAFKNFAPSNVDIDAQNIFFGVQIRR